MKRKKLRPHIIRQLGTKKRKKCALCDMKSLKKWFVMSYHSIVGKQSMLGDRRIRDLDISKLFQVICCDKDRNYTNSTTNSLTQKATKETTIIQIHKDLIAHRNRVEALTKRLDHVHSDVDMRLLISKTKLAAKNKQDLSSNRNVENLKQNVMKLRKENEVLKRRLLDSKDE
ncbi:hypothetical protein Tco_1131306 [Tanacetum coccineum]